VEITKEFWVKGGRKLQRGIEEHQQAVLRFQGALIMLDMIEAQLDPGRGN